MKVLNNYNECLNNLACSIQKYFGLPTKHPTLDFIDQLLSKHHPKNVVIILFDGMGANILKRTLNQDDFLIKNLTKSITTVFPATTTAATTSIRTGFNPAEHGWLGWTNYIAPIDKVITLFLNSEKGHDDEISQDFLKVKNQLDITTIAESINQSGNFHGTELMPFGNQAYRGLDEMLYLIKKMTSEHNSESSNPQASNKSRIDDETTSNNNSCSDDKLFIYAYDVEPDATMHMTGPDSPETQALIRERNQKVEQLAKNLHDTLLIVTADHGHIKVENIFLENYPEILDLLDRQTSLEQRATVFKVKPGKKSEFRKLFEEKFGHFYDLYDTDEILDAKLFGDGPEHPLFKSSFGDFLAIATSDKCLVAPGDEILISHHAGYTEDEILVPIITKYCK